MCCRTRSTILENAGSREHPHCRVTPALSECIVVKPQPQHKLTLLRRLLPFPPPPHTRFHPRSSQSIRPVSDNLNLSSSCASVRESHTSLVGLVTAEISNFSELADTANLQAISIVANNKLSRQRDTRCTRREDNITTCSRRPSVTFSSHGRAYAVCIQNTEGDWHRGCCACL